LEKSTYITLALTTDNNSNTAGFKKTNKQTKKQKKQQQKNKTKKKCLLHPFKCLFHNTCITIDAWLNRWLQWEPIQNFITVLCILRKNWCCVGNRQPLHLPPTQR
jgi:hypothetical protein